MMTSLNMVRHETRDYLWTRANWYLSHPSLPKTLSLAIPYHYKIFRATRRTSLTNSNYPILNWSLPEMVSQKTTTFGFFLAIFLASIFSGIPSEFQMGNLLCGHQSNIQLKRHDSGRVMIEGCVSDEYYLIRDLLYQQYAIVWAFSSSWKIICTWSAIELL